MEVNSRNEYGMTALHFAALRCASVRACGGRVASRSCGNRCNLDMGRFLVEAGANPYAARACVHSPYGAPIGHMRIRIRRYLANNVGITPLDIAIQSAGEMAKPLVRAMEASNFVRRRRDAPARRGDAVTGAVTRGPATPRRRN